jgi:glycosyltransferase involved in cell wall biosynthesis
MQRLKICQVAAGDEIGGMESHVLTLASALAERHEVTVAAHESWRDRIPEGVGFAPVDLTRWRYDPWAIGALRRTLRELAPDLVHAHASKAAQMTRPAARPLACARVATVHAVKRSGLPFLGFDRVIAVSREAAKRIRGGNVTVIHSGITPPTLPAEAGEPLLASLGAPKERPVACAVGRLARVKGYDILLRAWREVEAGLLIVGDGEDRAALERLATRLGVADRVVFTGWRDDTPSIIASCDLLVISSRREGGPITLIEALHVGTPVVSTRVGIAPDWLPDDCLCPALQPRALAATVRRALADHDAVDQAFAPVYERARRELTLDGMAQRVEGVYLDALRQRGLLEGG